jgi:hypothetical protein
VVAHVVDSWLRRPVGAQSPPDWQLNAVFYDGAKIKELFGDKAFVDWRDKYGPQRVVLVACQVSQSFNQLVVDALSRSGKGLLAGGLGPGCKPIASTQPIIFQAAGAQAESKYTQRAQYDALNPNDKATFEGIVRALNTKWGYFGAPPVPDAEVLRYYFDEIPKGAWVLVEVNKKDESTDTLRPWVCRITADGPIRRFSVNAIRWRAHSEVIHGRAA